jgi:hypothetical protein
MSHQAMDTKKFQNEERILIDLLQCSTSVVSGDSVLLLLRAGLIGSWPEELKIIVL